MYFILAICKFFTQAMASLTLQDGGGATVVTGAQLPTIARAKSRVAAKRRLIPFPHLIVLVRTQTTVIDTSLQIENYIILRICIYIYMYLYIYT